MPCRRYSLQQTGNMSKYNIKFEKWKDYINDVTHYKYYLYLLGYFKGNHNNDIIMMADFY